MTAFLWLLTLGSLVALVLSPAPGWLILALVFGAAALVRTIAEGRRSRDDALSRAVEKALDEQGGPVEVWHEGEWKRIR